MSRRHLIDIADLGGRDGISRVLDLATVLAATQEREVKKLPTLRGRTVVNLFFEASTRTSSSFELAAKRLSADVMNLKSSGSSVEKGESLKDTVLTLSAYHPDIVVIRHSQVGAARLATRYTSAHVVNAGDGTHEHPTQTLLDLYTIDQALRATRRHPGRGRGRHRALARRTVRHHGPSGDGRQVLLVGPPALIPRGIEATGVSVSNDIRDIASADVVYCLRMQRERMLEGANAVPSLREYALRFGVTKARLRPGQWVMHPGPMNRGVEIAADVADDDRSLILAQVEAGLVVRMAVLYDLVAHPQTAAALVEVA